MISNLAKKRRGQQNEQAIRPLVHMKAQEFINEVNGLRDALAEEKGELLQANGQLRTAILNPLRERVNELLPAESTKVLRKLYGATSFNENRDDDNDNLNIWLSEVLGHDKNNLATSFAYSTVRVMPENKTQDLTQVLTRLEEVNHDNGLIKKDIREIEQRLELRPVVPNVPAKVRRNEQEAKAYLREAINQMKSKGLKITNSTLRQYSGIGSRYVNRYYRELMRENCGFQIFKFCKN